MNKEVKNFGIGLGILIIILIALYLFRRSSNNHVVQETPTPVATSQFEQTLKDNFGIQIPDNAIKADLKDITGNNQMGIVTRDNNTYTVIANLDDLPNGYFYEGWL